MSRFVWTVRVYYEDTDLGGVVYYANYLKFMERTRSEWLRSHGIEQTELLDQQQIMFVVRRICVDYLKPARFNDLLEVTLDLAQLKRASVTLNQEIRLNPHEVLCRAQVQLACVHRENLKVHPLPSVFTTACTTSSHS